MIGFSAADELVLFEVVGLDIRIAADGEHLDIRGPQSVLEMAEPKLRQHRDALLNELRRRATATKAEPATHNQRRTA